MSDQPVGFKYSQDDEPNKKCSKENESTISKFLKAKDISLIAQIIAGLILVLFNAMCLIANKRILDEKEQWSVIMMCAALILFFSPIYFSIFLEKIFSKREGK